MAMAVKAHRPRKKNHRTLPAMGVPLGRRTWTSFHLSGALLRACGLSWCVLFSSAFVDPWVWHHPPSTSRVTMHVDVPGRLLQGWRSKTKRGPSKHHLPTGGPNVTKTADLMELRMSYAEDTNNMLPNERQLLKQLRSDRVEERQNASEILLKGQWEGRPQRPTLLKFLDATQDDDLLVRHNIAHLLKILCYKFRWEMDEWVALLAQKINPESTQDILTQVYVMKALGILGPFASSYSGYITRFFDHEEDYVRMVAVETVGQLTLEVPRHKRNLVRLLREDQSLEVRTLCDRVLKQRGWREPHWMKVQKPAWRERVIRSKANNNRGTSKGKKSVGKFGKIYWEKIKQK